MQQESVGEILGPYTLLALIGSGGAGRVYEAVDGRTGERVAIKIANSVDNVDPKAEDRFWREIEIVRRLKHPHILPLLDYGQRDDGTTYMVMPLVTEGTLRDRLTKVQTLTLDEACLVASNVGSALDYAHRRAIVHRDVKPHNIMLTGKGQVALADFGIVKVKSATTTVPLLTSASIALGTIHYMSPEQLAGGALDGRADIYSLGVVLYECLVGRLPYGGDTIPVAVNLLLNAHPIQPRQVNPDFPQPVEDILLRAISKERDTRFDTGRSLARALRASLDGLPVEESQHRRLVSTDQIAAAQELTNEVFTAQVVEVSSIPGRRFRALLLAALGLAAGVLAGGTLFARPLQRDVHRAQQTAQALASRTPVMIVTQVVTNAAGEDVFIESMRLGPPDSAAPTSSVSPTPSVQFVTRTPPPLQLPSPASVGGSGDSGESADPSDADTVDDTGQDNSGDQTGNSGQGQGQGGGQGQGQGGGQGQGQGGGQGQGQGGGQGQGQGGGQGDGQGKGQGK